MVTLATSGVIQVLREGMRLLISMGVSLPVSGLMSHTTAWNSLSCCSLLTRGLRISCTVLIEISFVRCDLGHLVICVSYCDTT